jgi:hypothetical protein
LLSFISLARQALRPAQAARLMVIGTIRVRIIRESPGEITRFVLWPPPGECGTHVQIPPILQKAL